MAVEWVLKMSYTVWNAPPPPTPTGFRASGAAIVNLAASQTQTEHARPTGDDGYFLLMSLQGWPDFLAF